MKMTETLWWATSGTLDIVRTEADTTTVVRDAGYVRPGSVSCELRDTGNGYTVRFPAHSSHEQDAYVVLDYDEARNLILALSPHAKALGFKV